MEILTAPANLPFTIALVIVLLLGALEILGLVLGGASTLVADADIDLDIDADADFDAGPLAHLLDWLHAGQIPTTILLIVFLFNFGFAGLALQSILKSTLGAMMPTGIALIPALLLALPATRMGGGVLRKLLPRDETEAVSRDSFLGCEAQITLGTARRGRPAEARLRDKFGRSHYVMVEPENDEETFVAGQQVLVLKRNGDIFRAMDNSGATIEEIAADSSERANSDTTIYGVQKGAEE